MEQRKIFAVPEFGKPVVHCFDDRQDSVATITEKIANTFLFQFLGRFARPMDQLHVKRDKGVPRIADQKNDVGPSQLPRRHQIFAPNPLPERRLHSLFGEIMRKDHARNVRLMITIGAERERFTRSLAKIGAEKSPHPGASAFRH